MQKVFVIIHVTWEDGMEVIGVAETEERAKRFAQKHHSDSYYDNPLVWEDGCAYYNESDGSVSDDPENRYVIQIEGVLTNV